MSLSQQLAELEQQRDNEVRHLHCTYLRTKRDMRRAVSPARFVRKHMFVSLAAGAALGVLLAPRPAPPAASDEAGERAVRKAHRRRGVSLSRLRRLLAKFVPEAAVFIPDETEQRKIDEEAEPFREAAKKEGTTPEKGGTLGMLMKIIEVIVPMFATRVDWRRLVPLVMQGMHQKMNEGSHNGREARVADAGTVRPGDGEDSEWVRGTGSGL